nr:hypothetical protein [Clostridiales bacterium]
MRETERKTPCYPCHIYEMADAKEAYESFEAERIKEYGDDVSLEDGTVLHQNYMWDDGGRTLVRCKKCGGLLIVQSSLYESFSDSPDGRYTDWIPAASEEEADLLNILYGARDMEDFPCRHLRRNNHDLFWTDGREPEACDPEDLIRAIREEYSGADPEQMEKLIRGARKGAEDQEPVPVRFFFADAMEEVRSKAPDGAKAWALIFDRTEDEDIREIQKMAAALDAFLRTDDVGFGDVHMRFVNDPGSDDVFSEKTEDGYILHLCAESGKHWCQTAYQLGYLMMHCLIDHLSDDEKGITWAEELICEAAALELFAYLSANWEKTPFGQEDPDYVQYLREYVGMNLSDQGTSAILRCRDREELRAVNERNLFDDRIDESHDLYHVMKLGDLQILAKIRAYEADDLLLYTHFWRDRSEGSGAVDYICRIQERIPGCEIPAGIAHEINLENSRPTDAQKRAFGQLIRALNYGPGEYIVFRALEAGKPGRDHQMRCASTKDKKSPYSLNDSFHYKRKKSPRNMIAP